MLFNSYAFVVFFLPITLLAFVALSRRGRVTSALVWLLVASLFFYGWWNPRYLVLLLASIVFNHAIGEALLRSGPQRRRAWLAFGIAVDLLGIGWFKYAGFLATNAAWLLGPGLRIPDVVLPLAISFFTFTQIAYLVDVHRGTAPHYDLLRYALFVTFFPHLIAGPIVRHGELIPQFDERRRPAAPGEDLAVGASIFAVGLFKKVVIADSLAAFATPVFAAAGKGTALGALEAWGGALAYTFQLYFDFSGYCDMAIGASLLFGMRLPANFDSPYKATSVIDFWRRWHMTLSRFLRDYLYVPLGGNRKGRVRRYLNLMITMLLGGLWHGAAWTFVLWGGLHGLYLVINHLFRALWPRDPARSTRAGRGLAWSLTFVAVVAAWVLFRAEDLAAAAVVYRGMVGLAGAGLAGPHFAGTDQALWLAAAALVAFALPNTQEWMASHAPVLEPVDPARARILGFDVSFRPTAAWAWLVAVLGAVAFTQLTRASEFLYFQF